MIIFFEIICTAIFFRILYAISFLIVPLLQGTSIEVIRVLLCMGLTITVQYVYTRRRIKYIIRKNRKLLSENQYDQSIAYLNGCLKRYRKNSTVNYEKFVSLAMAGRIAELREHIQNFRRYDRNFDEKYSYSVRLCEILYGFIGQYEVEGRVRSQNSPLERLDWLILEKGNLEMNEIIERATEILNDKYSLFKSAAAIILYQTYCEQNDFDKSNIYLKYAKQYAPSDEIMEYINDWEAQKTGDGSIELE